jgi:hypothetical protein
MLQRAVIDTTKAHEKIENLGEGKENIKGTK